MNPHARRALRLRLLRSAAGPLSLILAVIVTALALVCATKASGAEGRWVMAEVTAYCPCSLCCGDFADGRTASMTRVDRVPYAFAADKSLPFGARVYVPAGLGVLDKIRADDRWFAVDDRGGALDTEARRYRVLRLDLRVREHWWAVQFGRQRLPVFIATGNP
jgi:3D (Asp-Asp-Asp) domain-containing protein